MFIHTGADGVVWAVARVGPEARQLAGMTGKAVYIWEPGRAEPVQQLPAVNGGRSHCELTGSPDGNWLVAHGGHALHCWCRDKAGWKLAFSSDERGRCTARFTVGPATLTDVVAVGSGGGKPAVHVTITPVATRRRTGKPRLVVMLPVSAEHLPGGIDVIANHYYATDVSADGCWFLLSARQKVVRVWHVPERREVGALKLRGLPNQAAFSPDGTMFAVDGGTTVHVHRTETLEQVAAWRVKYSYVPRLAWSPDGRLLARTDDSTTVRALDVASGHQAWALGARGHRAWSVAFAPDGLTYAAGTFRGAVLVWDLE